MPLSIRFAWEKIPLRDPRRQKIADALYRARSGLPPVKDAEPLEKVVERSVANALRRAMGSQARDSTDPQVSRVRRARVCTRTIPSRSGTRVRFGGEAT